MHKFEMTLKDYRNHCNNFFNNEKLSIDNINCILNEKSVEDSIEWINYIANEYYCDKYGVILRLVHDVRGDYSPMESYDMSDPLQEPENRQLVNSFISEYNQVYHVRFYDLEIVQSKIKKFNNLRLQAQEELKLKIEVDGLQFNALARTDVLWSGWECDSSVWVVNHDGKNRLVTSNHGKLEFSNSSFLENKIAEYEKAIEESKKLLSLLT